MANIDKPEDSLLYRWVIEGKWKLLLTYDGKLGRYASSHPRTEKRPQLFDLLADPHEDQNLAAQHPEVVARLAAKLQEWWPVTERQVLTKWSDGPLRAPESRAAARRATTSCRTSQPAERAAGLGLPRSSWLIPPSHDEDPPVPRSRWGIRCRRRPAPRQETFA